MGVVWNDSADTPRAALWGPSSRHGALCTLVARRSRDRSHPGYDRHGGHFPGRRGSCLSADDLARSRAWFVKFGSAASDRQLEEDVAAGKLDSLALADEALRKHQPGEASELFGEQGDQCEDRPGQCQRGNGAGGKPGGLPPCGNSCGNSRRSLVPGCVSKLAGPNIVGG